MVSREELEELFNYKDGKIYGRWVDWRRKASNTRVFEKELGTPNGAGHLTVSFKDKRGVRHRELVHRVVFMMHYGWLPNYIDHINRDGCDNRLENIRPACKSLNSQNRGAQANTKYGLRGIYKDKLGGYCVFIGIDNRRVHIGRTECIGKAWRMRLDAERTYWPNARPDEEFT